MMYNRREAGVNFSQAKYKLLDNFTFIPHLRCDASSSIPYIIIDSFNSKPEVALMKIISSHDTKLRIKKLHVNGNSHVFSLKAEKKLKNLKIEVLDIKSEKELLSRKNSNLQNYLPKFTKKSTPIYVFDCGLHYFVGGHYKKDILISKNMLDDKNLFSFLGLYLAEGGKVDSSFTNSWPEAINLVLDFIENNFSIKRKDISASICCNTDLILKKKELEHYWKNKTGISNFFRNLHTNKNVKSPQGILELYFCSQTLKELFLSLLYNLDYTNNLSFINGFLSGDGSPILQNYFCVTHHIVFNPKDKLSNKYSSLFGKYKSNFINNNRLVIYSNWEDNFNLLLNGVYSYSPMKRYKFLKHFLSLPRTKKSKESKIENLRKEFKKLKVHLKNFYYSLADFNIYSKKEMEEFVIKNLK